MHNCLFSMWIETPVTKTNELSGESIRTETPQKAPTAQDESDDRMSKLPE
jgi:hypothetical protein